ncbi:MAG: AsmA family protein [Desulfuromonadaceae bacterium]|nr:AsmA family protein [Desulfuromonadaceae bacterium]
MKTLVKLVLGLLLLIAIAAGVGIYYLDNIAKQAIEYGGNKALGVTTTLNDIHIDLLGGQTSLRQLQIANPSGFTAPNFMTLESSQFALDLASLSSDTVIIPLVEFRGLKLNIEQQQQKSNIKSLLKKPSQLTAQSKTASPSPTEKPSSAGSKKFILKLVRLEDISVAAEISALGSKVSKLQLTLPTIELRNIGQQQGGLPLETIIQQLITAILNATSSQSGALAPLISGVLQGELNLEAVKAGAVQQATSELERAQKRLLEKQNLPAGSDPLVQQEGEKLLQGLQGLLNKKD